MCATAASAQPMSNLLGKIIVTTGFCGRDLTVHSSLEPWLGDWGRPFCKCPFRVCFENHFSLYIDFNVSSHTGNIIDMYNIIISSVSVYILLLSTCSQSESHGSDGGCCDGPSGEGRVKGLSITLRNRLCFAKVFDLCMFWLRTQSLCCR